MAKRWTVAGAIVLAAQYRKSDHSEEFAMVDAAWKDMCGRSENVAPLLFELAQYPAAVDLLKRFNTSCSVRKLQTAIEKHKDYSTEEADEEDEEEEISVTSKKQTEEKKEKKTPGRKPRFVEVERNLNVDELLDLKSLGEV